MNWVVLDAMLLYARASPHWAEQFFYINVRDNIVLKGEVCRRKCEMSRCHGVTLSHSHTVTMSRCHTVTLSHSHTVTPTIMYENVGYMLQLSLTINISL